MKLLLASLLFLNNLFAQSNKDLYITYDKQDLKYRIAAADQGSMVEYFEVTIQESNPYKYLLEFDKSGYLAIRTLVLGKNFPTFRFTYLNQNGNNPQSAVNKNDLKNVLKFEDILKLTDAGNFFDILNNFENIYLIDFTGKNSKLFAKKVKFERIPQL